VCSIFEDLALAEQFAGDTQQARRHMAVFGRGGRIHMLAEVGETSMTLAESHSPYEL
jgi:hypothetical protein